MDIVGTAESDPRGQLSSLEEGRKRLKRGAKFMGKVNLCEPNN
jgi:hypothetical protein